MNTTGRSREGDKAKTRHRVAPGALNPHGVAQNLGRAAGSNPQAAGDGQSQPPCPYRNPHMKLETDGPPIYPPLTWIDHVLIFLRLQQCPLPINIKSTKLVYRRYTPSA